MVDIASSAQDQSTALVEVNTAIDQVDQVTQQNAAMVEQATAAAHRLAQETAELRSPMEKFRLGADLLPSLHGAGVRPRASRRRPALRRAG